MNLLPEAVRYDLALAPAPAPDHRDYLAAQRAAETQRKLLDAPRIAAEKKAKKKEALEERRRQERLAQKARGAEGIANAIAIDLDLDLDEATAAPSAPLALAAPRRPPPPARASSAARTAPLRRSAPPRRRGPAPPDAANKGGQKRGQRKTGNGTGISYGSDDDDDDDESHINVSAAAAVAGGGAPAAAAPPAAAPVVPPPSALPPLAVGPRPCAFPRQLRDEIARWKTELGTTGFARALREVVAERKLQAADRARESRAVSRKEARARVHITETAQTMLERNLAEQKVVFDRKKFRFTHLSDMQARAEMANAEAAMAKTTAALDEMEASMAKVKLAVWNTSPFTYLATRQAWEASTAAAVNEAAMAKKDTTKKPGDVEAATTRVMTVWATERAAAAALARLAAAAAAGSASGASPSDEVSVCDQAYSRSCRDYVLENYQPLDESCEHFDNMAMQAFHQAADGDPGGWKYADPKVKSGLEAMELIYLPADCENDDVVHGPAEIGNKRDVEIRMPMYLNAKKACQVSKRGNYHRSFAIGPEETPEWLHVKSLHNNDASPLRASQVRDFYCGYLYSDKLTFNNLHRVDADCCQTLYVTRGRDDEEREPFGKDVLAALTFRVVRRCDNTPIFLIELQATDKAMHRKGIGRALLSFMMNDFMPPWSRDDDQAFLVTNAANYSWERMLAVSKKFRDGVEHGLMSPDARAAQWLMLIHMYDFAFPPDLTCLVWDPLQGRWDWHRSLQGEKERNHREGDSSCGLVFHTGNTWGEVRRSEGWEKFYSRHCVAVKPLK